MSHEIATQVDGTAAAVFSAIDGKGWHGLGRPIPEEISKDTDAIAKLAGLDFLVEKRECYFRDSKGNYIPAKGKDILVRTDTEAVLSVVSDNRYSIANRQPRDLVKAYQEQLEEHGLHMSHVAALRGGADIVVCARLPDEYNITVGKKSLKDVIHQFLTLSTGYNGHSTLAGKSSVRVVCANTLASGSQEARKKGTLKGIRASTVLQEDSLVNLLAKVKDLVEAERAQFDAMANTAMSNEDVTRYFADVLEINIQDLGKKDRAGNKLVSTKSENILREMAAAYANAPGAAMAHGTVWGGFNAVTYYCTHVKTTRDTYKDSKEAAMVASNLNGDAARVKLRALELASRYTGLRVAA